MTTQNRPRNGVTERQAQPMGPLRRPPPAEPGWQAMMTYVSACLEAGDHAALRAMGLGEAQVRRLAAMTMGELMRSEIAGGLTGRPMVRLHVDGDRLDAVLQSVERESARGRLIERCMQAGAPGVMMREMFGVTAKQFRSLQKRHGVALPVGRPAEPDPDTAEAIYTALERLGHRITAVGLLRVAAATGQPLSLIWRETVRHPDLALQREVSPRPGSCGRPRPRVQPPAARAAAAHGAATSQAA